MGMTFQQKFGLRVKEIRKRKGLTQEKLAEMISIGVRSLVKIETGNSFPSCDTLEKLIKALDTSNIEIFDFEHLQPDNELRELIIDMMDSNPNKIIDIYKVVKALVV